MRGAFGSNFAWQTPDLVNFDDVLKGSKAPFCETVVVFGHDDDGVAGAAPLGCLGLTS